MHPEKKKIFINKLNNLIGNVSDTAQKGRRRQLLFVSNEACFTLCDEYADEYNELLQELLLENRWGEKFSEKYISNYIRDIIAKTLKERATDNLDAYFEELINGFDKYSQEQIVLIPLANVVMHEDEFPIGKVILKRINDKQISQLMNKITTITNASKSSEKTKENFIQMVQAQLSSLRGKVCVEFRVIAEPERAKERAEEEARLILDLFHYSIPTLYPSNLNVSVGLEGEVIPSRRAAIIISSDAQSLSLPSQVVGSMVPFELSLSTINKMRDIGVFKVADILRKPESEITDFEDVILRGIHWFSNSLVQIELENKLLTLITCMETYLTPKDNSPISSTIAEGAALILTDGVENRKEIKKQIKAIYQKRSAISHGGRKEVMIADVDLLREITLALTMTMIDKLEEFKTHKQLFEWIETLKFS